MRGNSNPVWINVRVKVMRLRGNSNSGVENCSIVEIAITLSNVFIKLYDPYLSGDLNK